MLKHLLIDFQVVHLTGTRGENYLKPESSCFSHQDYHPIETVQQGMGDLLAKSDIVLTRAGMGILGELAIMQKDTILIPLPGTHQEDNARFIQENNAAEFVSQDVLAEQGLEWWKKYWKLRVPGKMGKRLHEILQDGGTNDFAKLLFEITDNR